MLEWSYSNSLRNMCNAILKELIRKTGIVVLIRFSSTVLYALRTAYLYHCSMYCFSDYFTFFYLSCNKCLSRILLFCASGRQPVSHLLVGFSFVFIFIVGIYCLQIVCHVNFLVPKCLKHIVPFCQLLFISASWFLMFHLICLHFYYVISTLALVYCPEVRQH